MLLAPREDSRPLGARAARPLPARHSAGLSHSRRARVGAKSGRAARAPRTRCAHQLVAGASRAASSVVKRPLLPTRVVQLTHYDVAPSSLRFGAGLRESTNIELHRPCDSGTTSERCGAMATDVPPRCLPHQPGVALDVLGRAVGRLGARQRGIEHGELIDAPGRRRAEHRPAPVRRVRSGPLVVNRVPRARTRSTRRGGRGLKADARYAVRDGASIETLRCTLIRRPHRAGRTAAC